MKSNREIEILFRRLQLYDRLERRAEGLVRAIQRVMGERYGSGSRSLRNRAHARPGRKNSARPEQVMALQWYDEKADNPPWIDALAELRQRATRDGYCHQHVQAIIVAIDQYAEKALGNRDYFLNKGRSEPKAMIICALASLTSFVPRWGHLSGYVPKGGHPSHGKPNLLSKVPAAFLR